MNDNTVQNAEFKETEPSKIDKFADYLGIICGLILMTCPIALALNFSLTIIPIIHFTILNICKCWAGILACLLLRGVLKTKI